MAILIDPVAQAIEDEREKRERAWDAQEARVRREHDYRMAKLEFSVNTRHKVLMAFAKAPVLFVLAFTVPKLIRSGKDVPKFLQTFMSL
jgi:hypothetical protein